jgi:SAM-dependent methyltransferase
MARLDLIELLHGGFVHRRRTEVLARHVASLVPSGASIVDVGCGDGRIAAEIKRRRPDVMISGLDVLRRSRTHIAVREFDGLTIPYADRSVDVALFVDVLHHTSDPLILLTEARRVMRRALIIKDHVSQSTVDHATLRFMDWLGNSRHGVALPFNYWTLRQWQQAAAVLGLKATAWKQDLQLYPSVARCVFERSLHFMAMLAVDDTD